MIDPKEGLKKWLGLADLGQNEINSLLPEEIEPYIYSLEIEQQYLVLQRMADLERNAYHFMQALGYWDRVHNLGTKNHRNDWIIEALLGKFNASSMINTEKALKNYLLPAKLLGETDVPEKLSRIYYEIGFAYRQMQDVEKSIRWYNKSLEEFRQRPQDQGFAAIVLNDLGYALSLIGRWGDAIKYVMEALSIRQNILKKYKRVFEN